MKKRLLLFSCLLVTCFATAQFGCGSAISLFDGYTSGVVTTPGTSATSAQSWVSSALTDGNTSSAGFTNGDVYLYKYTTGSAPGESIYFTIQCDYAVDGVHSIGVWTGCSGSSLSACVISTTAFKNILGVCVNNLAANTTYYIGVGKEYASTATTATGIASRKLVFSVVDFTVEYSTTTPSDECATASIINVDSPYQGSTRCTYTPSAGSPATFPNSCGSIENDSWMRFVAGSSTVVIDYEVFNCSNGNGVQLSVFSGTCSSLSLISGSCINYASNNSTGTWTLTGLTIGSTYYIRTDGYAGDLCSYSFNPVSGVLNVELVDFYATGLSNGSNVLKWKTLTESNSAYFAIERSTDGLDFEHMETLQGAGNSEQVLNYITVDEQPPVGTVYYRIKAVDTDGRFTYSEVKTLANSAVRELSLFPNPSETGVFTLDLNGKKGMEYVQLFTLDGKLLRQETVTHTGQQIDLSNLVNGVYIALFFGQNEIIKRSITIQK